MTTHNENELPQDAEKPENKSNEDARARLLKIIDDLDPEDYESLAALGEAIIHNSGSITPAEDFIDSIAVRYASGLRKGEGLTPDIIEKDLDEFKSSLETAVRATRWMRKHYPQLVGAK